MRMLSAQAAELRNMAAAMSERGSAIGLDYGMGRELVDAARMMREAADTIEKLDAGTCRNVDADQGWFECSECKCICSVDWYGSGFGTPKFCPSCGKKVEQ